MRCLLNNQLTSLGTARVIGYLLSKVVSAVITASGSGYSLRDIVTVTGVTPIACKFMVKSLDNSGGVNGLVLLQAGIVASGSKPSNPVATTAVNGQTGSASGGTGLTLTLTYADDVPPEGTDRVQIQAETQALRIREDGTAPTASVGYSLTALSAVTLDVTSAAGIKIIEATASGKANIAYYSSDK